MKYAVLIEESVVVPDGYGGDYRMNYIDMKEFKTQDELLTWITNNDTGYYRKKYRPIQYQELTVNRSVSITEKE